MQFLTTYSEEKKNTNDFLSTTKAGREQEEEETPAHRLLQKEVAHQSTQLCSIQILSLMSATEWTLSKATQRPTGGVKLSKVLVLIPKNKYSFADFLST